MNQPIEDAEVYRAIAARIQKAVGLILSGRQAEAVEVLENLLSLMPRPNRRNIESSARCEGRQIERLH